MAEGTEVATDEAPAGPPRVALVAVAGAVLPDVLLDALRREVISVSIMSPPGRAGAPAPEGDVVLAWLPSDLGADVLESLVRWASSADPPAGLIGAAPGGTRADCEDALAAGFDDYVIGEVSPRELAARIRALVRRLALAASGSLEGARYGSITLDPARHQAWVGGHRIPLTRTELSVMAALVTAHGRAVTRGELLDAAWGDDSLEVGERAVDNVVLRLRRKLGNARVIVTVRGVGFRLADA
jgi:DNA-binding response OmpR family regulator